MKGLFHSYTSSLLTFILCLFATSSWPVYAVEVGIANSDMTLSDQSYIAFLTTHPNMSYSFTDTLDTHVKGPVFLHHGEKKSAADFSFLQYDITFKNSDWDIKLGNQQLNWGVSDFTNPSSFFQGYDYTTNATDLNDGRKPLPALRLLKTLANGFIELAIAEHAPLSTVPIDANRVAQVKPYENLGFESGLRYRTSLGGTDLSGILFYGYDRVPHFGVIGLGSNFKPIIQAQPSRMYGLGLNMARSIGNYNVRAESAWLDYKDKPSSTVPALDTDLSRLVNVIGADRNFGDFNINLELSDSYALDTKTSSNPLDSYNRLISGLSPDNRRHATFAIGKVSYSTTSSIDASLTYMRSLQPSSDYLSPRLTYYWTPDKSTSITFGADIFTGSDNSFYGLLTENRRVFVALELPLPPIRPPL